MRNNISTRITNLSVGMALAFFLWGAAGAAKMDNTPPHMDKPRAIIPDAAPGKVDATLQTQVSNILGTSPLVFAANAAQPNAQVE